MSEEETVAELAELREAWLGNPYTVRAMEMAGRDLEQANVALLRICERSTDPDVRAAIAKLRAEEEIYQVLGGKV